MAVTDAVIAIPKYDIDKVIRTQVFTFTSGFGTIQPPSVTGMATDTFILGIFTADGGVTWNDTGIYANNSTVSATPPISVMLRMYSDGSLVITFPTGGGSISPSNPITIKVAYLWRPGMPDPEESAMTYTGSTSYKSANKYMKIYTENQYDVATNNTTVIPHGLGYPPMVRVFIRDHINTTSEMAPLQQITNNNAPSSQDQFIQVDSNNITIQLGNFVTYPATVFYRVYYEGF